VRIKSEVEIPLNPPFSKRGMKGDFFERPDKKALTFLICIDKMGLFFLTSTNEMV